MIDLTEQEWLELYGIDNEDRKIRGFKPDFTKWVAIPVDMNEDGDYDDYDDDELAELGVDINRNSHWHIAPKVFWERNGFIPDSCIGFEVPGFYECQEHKLEANEETENPKQQLKQLGFEIIDNPVWGWCRKKQGDE